MSTKKGKDRRHPSRTRSRAGWRTPAPRDTSVALRTVLPSIVGTPVLNSTAGTPITVTYTAPAMSMVVMEITTYGILGQPVPVSGVSDTGGLTWRRRRQITFATTYVGTGSLASACQQVTKEVWWAFTTVAQTSKTLSVALSNTANQDTGSDLFAFCVQDVANPSAPWDDDATLEAVNSYPNGTTATPTSITVSGNTTQKNGLVLAGLFAQNDTANSTPVTLNSGWTSVVSDTRGVSPGTLFVQVASASQATPGAITNPFNGSKGNWFAWLDAISGTVGGGSARDTTTKPTGLVLDAAAVNVFDNQGIVKSLTATISTSYADDILIAVVQINNFAGGGAGTVVTSTITDLNGLNWQLRSRTSGQNTGPTFSITQEVWWARVPTPVIADQITATFSVKPSQASSLTVFAVSGSPNPSAPWDANASLPNLTSHMTGTTSTMQNGVPATTTSTKSMLFAFACYAANGHTVSTDPSGFTTIFETNGAAFFVYNDYKGLSAAGSNAVAWVNGQDFYQVTIDALTGDPVATGATANGAILTITSSLIDGVASGAVNATANGDTLIVTTSPINGAASGDGVASGATLTLTTTIVVGEEDVSEEAALLAVTTSIIPGAATGDAVAAGAAGTTLTLTTTLIAGATTGDAVASGDTVTIATTIVVGEEDVSEEANLLVVATSIVPGTATSDSTAPGDTVTVTISLIDGQVISDTTAPGDTVSVTLALIEGRAGAGEASGQLVQLIAEIIPGSVVTGANGGSKVVELDIVLLPGSANVTGVDGGSAGATLTLLTSVISGEATGQTDAQADGQVFTIFVSLDVGAAEGQVPVSSGQTLGLSVALVPGTANNGEVGAGSGGGIGGRRAVGGNPFTWSPPKEIVNATAHGEALEVGAELRQGHVVAGSTVEVVRYVETAAPPIAPLSVMNVVATGHVVSQIMALASGSANGDAVAFGQLIEDEWDWDPHNESMIERAL